MWVALVEVVVGLVSEWYLPAGSDPDLGEVVVVGSRTDDRVSGLRGQLATDIACSDQ